MTDNRVTHIVCVDVDSWEFSDSAECAEVDNTSRRRWSYCESTITTVISRRR